MSPDAGVSHSPRFRDPHHTNGRGPNGNPRGPPNVSRMMRAVTTGDEPPTAGRGSATATGGAVTARGAPPTRPRSTPPEGHATMPFGRPWASNGAGRLVRQRRGETRAVPRPASLAAFRRRPIRRGVKAASRILVPMVQVRILAAEQPAPRSGAPRVRAPRSGTSRPAASETRQAPASGDASRSARSARSRPRQLPRGACDRG